MHTYIYNWERKAHCEKIIAPLIFALLIFGAVLSGITDIIDKNLEGSLYHNPAGVSEKIKIIKIDERSISELGPYENWDRGMYARPVNTLSVSENIKPAVIGFDVFSAANTEKRQTAALQRRAPHTTTCCVPSAMFLKGRLPPMSRAISR